MKNHSVRPADDEIEKTVKTYYDMLFKLCFAILADCADAEDAVSDTFLRYITRSPEFNGEEHKKAWLIHVATNVCKSMRRFRVRHAAVNLDDVTKLAAAEHDREILECVMRLAPKYRSVLHLYYIEGYKTAEIASMTDLSVSAVKKRLQYAREKLRIEYDGGN